MRTPCLRAASRTICVPSTFVRGTSRDRRCSDRRATRPRRGSPSRRRRPGRRPRLRRPRPRGRTQNVGSPSCASRFARLPPVESRSSTVTVGRRSSSSASTRWEPMKPAPPVTSTFVSGAMARPRGSDRERRQSTRAPIRRSVRRRRGGLAQDGGGRASRCLPGESRRSSHPRGGQHRSQVRVADQLGQRRRDRVDVRGIHQHRRLAGDLGQRGHVRRQDGHARRERLEHREPEPLVERRIREHRGAGEQRELVAVVHVAGAHDPLLHARRELLDRRRPIARSPPGTTAPDRRRSRERDPARRSRRTPAPATRGSSAARCRRRTTRTHRGCRGADGRRRWPPAAPARTPPRRRRGARRAPAIRRPRTRRGDPSPSRRTARRSPARPRGSRRTAGATARRCAARTRGSAGTRGRGRSARRDRDGWSRAPGSSSPRTGRNRSSHSTRGIPSRYEAGWKIRAGKRDAFSVRFRARTSAKNLRGRKSPRACRYHATYSSSGSASGR